MELALTELDAFHQPRHLITQYTQRLVLKSL